MTSRIRWGILGTGWIAHRMAEALAVLPDARLVAVGSRTREKAEAFGKAFDVPLRFDRYEKLAACPEVDVVYVATPHVFHRRDATLALQAGKAVLCEKPLTVNATEAEALVSTARSEGLFLMEAMWTRFVPAVARLRTWIADGAIGDVHAITADIGWAQPYDPDSRIYSPDLAGGALLDVGIYPVSLAAMLLGTPSAVSGVMHPAPTGVDAQCAVSLAYPDGAVAAFAAVLPTDTPRDLLVIGSEGWIRLHPPITHPEGLTRGTHDGPDEVVELPHLGNGYTHEAIEVMSCLRAGKLESEIMPLDESLSILRTLDSIRELWGLRYPADGEPASGRSP